MTNDARTERLTGDGLLTSADDLHSRLKGLLVVEQAQTLDLSDIGDADISFVQLIASASLTAERAGQALTLIGLSPKLRIVFEKAGVVIDPAAGRISHN